MLQCSQFFEPPGPLPEQMAKSDGTGKRLLKDGPFGADLIRFAAGKGVRSHVHPGDHMLFVLSGNGILTFDGQQHAMYPGFCYFVPGTVPHAIEADSELTLLSIANQHIDVASDDRLERCN